MNCYAFIGIQGSGKGTQAEQLSSTLHYQHINIGDLFRYHIKNNTQIGVKVQQIINRGELVPDDVVFELVEASIDKIAKGIVFDGFPRTIQQADFLLKHYSLLRVFYIELSETAAYNRIAARRVCPNCNENYNLKTQPPKIPETCDKCGSKLIIRQDDSPEAIHKRFKEFYNQTQPLKNFFETNNVLTIINGDLSVSQVFEQILALTTAKQ